MAKSTVEILRGIKERLEETASNIEDREYVSDAMQEKADAYNDAASSLEEAIDALESIG